MRRTSFTNEQRAQIFALDRAICAYSGKNLWIADYGIDPSYEIDWIDHIVPVSRGGESSLSNGVASSYLQNSIRNDVRVKLILFYRGVPTTDHRISVGVLDPGISVHLHRFRALDQSDWYLNGAMYDVCFGMQCEFVRRQGMKWSRDQNYWARAALKALATWRVLVEKGGVRSLEERGLAPTNPEWDQKQLLGIREATSIDTLLETMKNLFPGWEALKRLLFAFSELENPVTRRTARTIITRMESQTSVPSRIRLRLAEYDKSWITLMR